MPKSRTTQNNTYRNNTYERKQYHHQDNYIYNEINNEHIHT